MATAGLEALGISENDAKQLATQRRVRTYVHEANVPIILIEHEKPTDDDRLREFFDLLCELDLESAIDLIKDYRADLSGNDTTTLMETFIRALNDIAPNGMEFRAGDDQAIMWSYYRPSAPVLNSDELEDDDVVSQPKTKKATAKRGRGGTRKGPGPKAQRGTGDEQQDEQPKAEPAWDADEAVRRAIAEDEARDAARGREPLTPAESTGRAVPPKRRVTKKRSEETA